MNCGDRREAISIDDEDWHLLLEKSGEAVEKTNSQCMGAPND